MYFVENYTTSESKTFFESNYSHIYYIFNDNFATVEADLKQRGLYTVFNFDSTKIDVATFFEDAMLWLVQKKLCLFPVTRPTLIFGPDPKVFIALDDKMR